MTCFSTVSRTGSYANGGHQLLDFTNKLLELGSHPGMPRPDRTFTYAHSGRGRRRREAEETSAWRSPVDVIALIQESENELRKLDFSRQPVKDPSDPKLPELLAG